MGTQTAALMFGGQNDSLSPPKRGETEEYNGTGWSVEATCPSALGGIGSAGVGTQTAALAFAGNNLGPLFNNTESWDGSSWTEDNNLNTARDYLGGAGTQTSALAFGGAPVPSRGTTTEEFTGETTAVNITDFTTS